MTKIAPTAIARMPVRPLLNIMPTIPPSIDSPAVQFKTPRADDGETSGAGGVHGTEPMNGLVVCPHEQPDKSRQPRQTSIDMPLIVLPMIQPPKDERWSQASKSPDYCGFCFEYA